MKKVIAGLVVGAGLALAGCSSGFSCSSKGPCANDPTPSSADTTACQSATSGACGSEFSAVQDCVYDNPACTSAGVTGTSISGTLAPDGGFVFTGACGSQLTSLGTCCGTNPTAAGCT